MSDPATTLFLLCRLGTAAQFQRRQHRTGRDGKHRDRNEKWLESLHDAQFYAESHSRQQEIPPEISLPVQLWRDEVTISPHWDQVMKEGVFKNSSKEFPASRAKNKDDRNHVIVITLSAVIVIGVITWLARNPTNA